MRNLRKDAGSSSPVAVSKDRRPGTGFAALRADRASGRFSQITTVVFRLGQESLRRRWLRVPYHVLDLVWVRLLMGAELPRTAVCGPGLKLKHGGRGVILHPRAVLGSGVVIYHRVTVGERGAGPPTIGDRVLLGAGSAVLGEVVVDDGASVGAGAVLVHDAPAGALMVGVPARNAKGDPAGSEG